MTFRAFLLILPALFLSFMLSAQNKTETLNTWLEEHTKDMGGRSLLAVWKDGKLVYNHAVNTLNKRQQKIRKAIAKKKGKEINLNDLTLQSRLPIASCSKWLSAALVMTFVDDGSLALSDTVGKFLPIMSLQGKGHITIEQCLSHTTGINDEGLKKSLKSFLQKNSMDEAIESIAALQMEGEPGKVFRYGNVGLQIAGAVIEKISGKDFETLFAERIAKPLDMKNTDFGHKNVPLVAGGVAGTPEDYLHFLQMILNKGVYNGKSVLSEQSLQSMMTNRITENVQITYSPEAEKGLGYGLGVWIIPNNVVSSPGLFGTYPWINTGKNYAAILFSFNINKKGRHQRYAEITQLVENTFCLP